MQAQAYMRSQSARVMHPRPPNMVAGMMDPSSLRFARMPSAT